MSHKNIDLSVGKVTILTVLFGVAILALGFMMDSRHLGQFQTAMATSTVATSVTVLNTPPVWNGSTAEESPESSAANPTNSGDTVTWVTTAKDNNGEDYFLLICKTAAAPTAHNDGKPTCDSLANTWGVSATTTSEAQSSVATTTAESWTASNAWWGWICDSNAGNARCNAVSSQGTGGTGSPFVVNHRPAFTAFADDTPADPGATITWTTTSSDPEGAEADDTIDLYVCQTNSFATSTRTCNGGEWCHTTPTETSTSDVGCSYELTAPNPDRNYTAYGFVVDQHEHGALYTGGNLQGTDSVVTIRNVTPTVSAATVSLTNSDDTQPLILTTAHGETAGFKVKFTVTDNNSCIANASTTPEITNGTINVYRSSVLMANCDSSGDWNTNQCYTDAVATAMWQPSCTQDANTCLGEGDSTAAWTCTFPLWYNADPTGAGTFYTGDKWYASVQAYDKLYATSTPTEIQDAGAPLLQSLLAYDVPTAAIPYDALEPGTDSTTLSKTTALAAWGNVGLDEILYGDDMCTTYGSDPACDEDNTHTVFSENQEFGLSALAYGAGTDLLESSVGQTLLLDVSKTTSTSTPQSKSTYWGIGIPGTITLAGSYTGQNYLAGKVSDPANW